MIGGNKAEMYTIETIYNNVYKLIIKRLELVTHNDCYSSVTQSITCYRSIARPACFVNRTELRH